jgi:Ca-activated chloride channel homolog
LFSGSAFEQSPMTSDYGAFTMFLDQVSVETIASGTTAIDRALEKGIGLFKRGGDRKNKLVLLVTDGEDFSTNLDSVKVRAKDEGIKVIAYGVGTPDGAPIPKIGPDGRPNGHETEADGSIALSKLDETRLKELAHDLGGTYIRATRGDEDLKQIVSFVTSFEREQYEDYEMSLYEDRYPIFAALSAGLLALEWVL